MTDTCDFSKTMSKAPTASKMAVKSAAGSALSQSGRKFGRTSDGVTIYKPAAGAKHFTAKELRAAVSEARSAK